MQNPNMNFPGSFLRKMKNVLRQWLLFAKFIYIGKYRE
jgi:hypothetical protein